MKMPKFPNLGKWAQAHLLPLRRSVGRFLRPSSFSLPRTPSAAVPRRLRRNLRLFRVYYAVLLWVLLLLSLLPAHRRSMLFLMASSKVALLCEVLLRAVPPSWALLRRALDRRVALGIFLLVVLADLAVAGAVGRLGVAAAIGAPVVAVHAVFRSVGEDADAEEDADGANRDLEEGTSR